MGLILSPLKSLDDGLPALAGGIADADQLITLSPFVFPSWSVSRLLSHTSSVVGEANVSQGIFGGSQDLAASAYPNMGEYIFPATV